MGIFTQTNEIYKQTKTTTKSDIDLRPHPKSLTSYWINKH